MATPNLTLTQYSTTDTINYLTQYNTDMTKIDTAVNTNKTNIGTLASLKTAVKTSVVNSINEVYDTTDNGWISARATLTYASASAPTFVCNTSTDLTTRISVGMKIKLTQTTAKYFFVTAITSTTITLYGGTDYVVANATISNVYFSSVKSPFGFPMNPNKWSILYSNSSLGTQSNPTVGTWYNVGSNLLAIEIGAWNLSYKAKVEAGRATAGNGNISCTLSIGNNSESDSDFTLGAGIANATGVGICSSCSKNINLTAKTIFYLNVKSIVDGMTALYVGSGIATTIKATCAYL